MAAVSRVRSRRGFETLLQQGRLADRALVQQAIAVARLSITQAYLLPCIPDVQDLPPVNVSIEPVVLNGLRRQAPGSGLHLALVEVVRRQYKLAAQAADKADKEAIRSAGGPQRDSPQSGVRAPHRIPSVNTCG